jgi:hypothetical protein
LRFGIGALFDAQHVRVAVLFDDDGMHFRISRV